MSRLISFGSGVMRSRNGLSKVLFNNCRGSKWDQVGKFFFSSDFEPIPRPRPFGKDPNAAKIKPHPPPVFLKPGEKPDEFDVVCYKLHFIRINNLGHKLKLAALYMQATEGSNTDPEPPKDDRYEHAYWNAWKQLGSMSKDEARKEYIRIGNKNLDLQKKNPDLIINN